MRPENQDFENANPLSPEITKVGFENLEDEVNILADQDETLLSEPGGVTENTGDDGTRGFATAPAEFARGEIDVEEQMDRTTASMDAAFQRKRNPSIPTPLSPAEISQRP